MTFATELQPDPPVVARLRTALDAAGARYRILHHPQSVTSAEDGASHGFGALEQMAPTLILRTEQGYLAAIISGATRLSYKKIKKHLGLRDVSMASPAEVLDVTGADVGAVAMINPGLRTLIDSQLPSKGEVFGGCGVPRYSLAMDASHLISITAADVFDFAEPRNP
jgi:prolyl-tRNA editing enzyme YbaK/EbsC (Cys-tRNA(Pro) deacylase)